MKRDRNWHRLGVQIQQQKATADFSDLLSGSTHSSVMTEKHQSFLDFLQNVIFLHHKSIITDTALTSNS